MASWHCAQRMMRIADRDVIRHIALCHIVTAAFKGLTPVHDVLGISSLTLSVIYLFTVSEQHTGMTQPAHMNTGQPSFCISDRLFFHIHTTDE